MPDIPDVGLTVAGNLVQDVLDQQSALQTKISKHDFSIDELTNMDAKELEVVQVMRLQDIRKLVQQLIAITSESAHQTGEQWLPYDLSTAPQFEYTLTYDTGQRASIITTVASTSALSFMLPGGGVAFTKTLTTGTWYKLDYPPGTRIYQVTGNTFAKGIIHYGDDYLGSDM